MTLHTDQRLAEIRVRDENLYNSRSARDLVHQDRHILLRLLDIEQRKTASVRLMAEQIKRYADWPGITDTATYPEIVESLRVLAAGLVRELTPGLPPRDARSDAETPATPAVGRDTDEGQNGSQGGAGDVGAADPLPNTPKSPSEIAVGDTIWSGGTWFTVASVEQWDNFTDAQGATSTWSADQAVHVREPQPATPPACDGCGLPETNCACG